jgi:uncharacterized protein YdaU (DUF1376 family)
MHYYQFHIGDYASHTAHLDEIEDLAYRRMLDYCYLNEIGLPESVEEIARLIRMRTHSERIANVLLEFFTLHDDGIYRQCRVEQEITEFRGKSEKAKQAARKRWGKPYANALPTHSERNANHKPLTINHKPVITTTTTRPTIDDIAAYTETRDVKIDPQRFHDYYTANGWKVGRNAMKDWKAAVRTWERKENGNQNTGNNPRQTVHQGRPTKADEVRAARERARLRHSTGQSDLGSVVADV